MKIDINDIRKVLRGDKMEYDSIKLIIEKLEEFEERLNKIEERLENWETPLDNP